MQTEFFLEAIVVSESKLQLKPVGSLREEYSKDLWLFGFIQPFLPYDESGVSWDCIPFVKASLNMRP